MKKTKKKKTPQDKNKKDSHAQKLLKLFAVQVIDNPNSSNDSVWYNFT